MPIRELQKSLYTHLLRSNSQVRVDVATRQTTAQTALWPLEMYGDQNGAPLDGDIAWLPQPLNTHDPITFPPQTHNQGFVHPNNDDLDLLFQASYYDSPEPFIGDKGLDEQNLNIYIKIIALPHQNRLTQVFLRIFVQVKRHHQWAHFRSLYPPL